MNIKKILIGTTTILFIIIFICVLITLKKSKKIDVGKNINVFFESTPQLEENLKVENNTIEFETTDTIEQSQVKKAPEVKEQQEIQETLQQGKNSVSPRVNTNETTSQISQTISKTQVENKESMPTQTQEKNEDTQEKNEIVTPPSTETKEETMNEEKYIRNDTIINKIKSVINNNPSEYMKTYGYNIVVDNSIKEHCNQFTFTENRIKSYITYCFGTIRIYAEDYYKNGQLIMTECYIY